MFGTANLLDRTLSGTTVLLLALIVAMIPFLGLTEGEIQFLFALFVGGLVYVYFLRRARNRWGWARLAPFAVPMNVLLFTLAFSILHRTSNLFWIGYFILPLTAAHVYGARWAFLSGILASLGYFVVIASQGILFVYIAEQMLVTVVLLTFSLLAGGLTESVRRQQRELESRVAQRTAELADSNAQLQTELQERQRTEETLSLVNAKLTGSLQESEWRNREMFMLTEIDDLLQTCFSVEEAFQVINQFVRKFFPNEAGTVYVLSPSRDLLEAVAVWGEVTLEREFAPADCLALRSGRVYRVEDVQSNLICPHVHASEAGGYLCVPMMALSEILGLVHLQHPAGVLSDSTKAIAITLAGHIALALANLKLRESLHQMSFRDGLTGLFNRRYMEETLERELRRAARAQKSLGIVMLDLDHFKQFNDEYGHEAGDKLLRELGSLLNKNIRAGDIACRYGGEEFTLILSDASLETIMRRAEQVHDQVKHLHVRVGGHLLEGITASLGVALYPNHAASSDDLLRAADHALYQAKKEGRNQVVVAEPSTAMATDAPKPTEPNPTDPI
ncbi:MAG: diguanylate cyclase [Chloroflexi bacterium]|nr:diguanylate cyclase [Chloroflexota bacterium]